MIAMLFGTVPIAHKVGGLRDSIRDGVNGFLFDSYSAEQLERTAKKAIGIWKSEKQAFEKIVESALATDFSWKKSAQSYLDIYRKLVENGF
jgi:starch synthase